ncbi:MAG: type II CAAX endopeptidase family protein [Bacillota bacterium]
MTLAPALGGALLLWAFVFIWHPIGFWASMALATGILGTFALAASRRSEQVWGPSCCRLNWLDLAWGAGSALVLAAVFHVGGWVLRSLWPGSAGYIGAVYTLDTSVPLAVVVAALLVIIGPGEELFWRLFVQERLSGWLGPGAGWAVATTIYGGIHVLTRNPVLVLAALVAGAFWGLMWWKARRPWALIVSHAVWDVLMFVVWPV